MRGATRAAKRGRLADELNAILGENSLDVDDLVKYSAPDLGHEVDREFIKKILIAGAFPDSDTFVNIIDALLEHRALTLLGLRRLEYLYAEESIAWDRHYKG